MKWHSLLHWSAVSALRDIDLEESKEKIIFETMPIRRAVTTLAVPTVISQLIVLVYNMADTWFIGQTKDPYQVAAVTVCYPIFMLLAAISNLFGIGGGSLISRLLGRRDYHKAGTVATFTIWASAAFTLVYSAVIFLSGRGLLGILGTDAGTMGYALDYLRWTVVAGGLSTVLNMVMAASSAPKAVLKLPASACPSAES